MDFKDRLLKRSFDMTMSLVGLTFAVVPIILLWVISSVDTKGNGFFVQKRIGRYGMPFYIYKLKSMRDIKEVKTTVTTSNDPRISSFGRFLRKYKLDELPQLFNVLIGKMSFVGPRPDVSGFADNLQGSDRNMLNIRPGITGPASIYFKNEEFLLSEQVNPEGYNRNVIWPTKVAINLRYISRYSFTKDTGYILHTIFGFPSIDFSYVNELEVTGKLKA